MKISVSYLSNISGKKMTQNEHNLIAGMILIIGYQIIFHTILKHHPVTKKNIKELFDIFKEYF